MLKIGITGGIGTGKTTACRMFERIGIKVYYADERARWIQNNNPVVIESIKELFGKEIYQDGLLKRDQVSRIVFSDRTKLDLLNMIVHPAVIEDAANWQKAEKERGAIYTLKEAALLFESGSYKQLDKIIVVTADDEVRIERVMKRDKINKEEVLQRINNQMPQSEKEKLADFILYNDNFESLEKQVASLHHQILEIAKN